MVSVSLHTPVGTFTRRRITSGAASLRLTARRAAVIVDIGRSPIQACRKAPWVFPALAGPLHFGVERLDPTRLIVVYCVYEVNPRYLNNPIDRVYCHQYTK